MPFKKYVLRRHFVSYFLDPDPQLYYSARSDWILIRLNRFYDLTIWCSNFYNMKMPICR